MTTMKTTLVWAVAIFEAAILLFPSQSLANDKPAFTTIDPSQSEIEAAQATVEPASPTSDVKGVAFNRMVQIWLENTDMEAAQGNEDMQALASQGILLTNYFAVTHPSQPNYMASVSGDHFGLDSDEFVRVPSNVSTVVDLLEAKEISWGSFQEHMPYPGFEGIDYWEDESLRHDYERKHNALILFDSVAGNDTRRRQVKNFANFQDDWDAGTLPQWAFLTPSMANDGHDTGIDFSAAWLRGFLEPLLADGYFNQDTLVVVTFDERESRSQGNRVYTLLLGGAIPKSLYGTTDHTHHTHYSLLSTVSVNWDLPSLGRWDCQATVFDFVASKAGVPNPTEDTAGMVPDAASHGPLSSKQFTPGQWPAPATNKSCIAGNGVLGSVKETWSGQDTVYPDSAGSDSVASRELDGASATVVMGFLLLLLSLGR